METKYRNNKFYEPAAAADVGDKLDRAETQKLRFKNASQNYTLLCNKALICNTIYVYRLRAKVPNT